MTVEKQLLYLLSKSTDMEGKAIIKIFEEMNYTSQSIRNMLSKLKRNGYITSLDRGMYSITRKGLDVHELYAKKENFYMIDWDGMWYFILLEIPETLRKKRDSFRSGLLKLGYGQLYKSVYVYPWNIIDKVLNLIDSLEIEEYVTIISSDNFLLNGIYPEGKAGPIHATSIWNLKEINSNYYEIKNLLEETYKPRFNHLIKDKNRDVLQVFIFFLELKKIKDELMIADPMLPAEFLPSSWLGTTILFSLDKYIEDLVTLIPENSYYYPFVSDICS